MFNKEVLLSINFKDHWREGLMGLVMFIGIGFIFFGLWLVAKGPEKKQEVILSPVIQETRGEIVVEIAGAVENPGTYEVGEGSRVSDLVKKAGGFSKEADRIYLAAELNLAKKIADEEKVYIRFIGEGLDSSKLTVSEVGSSGMNLISINNASKSQLEELDGVGEKRASEIILQRPYQSVEELVSKSVVSASVLENNKGRLKL
jgi:competence protein ComEA